MSTQLLDMASQLKALKAENLHLRQLLTTAGITPPEPDAVANDHTEPSTQETGSASDHLKDQVSAGTCKAVTGEVSQWTHISEHRLTNAEVERYSRQLLLPLFGTKGQERLCRGSALVIGAGGLGSPAALYLAATGVGRIGIVDKDVVELNNLHRQVIHTEAKVGKPKVHSAAATCQGLNSLIQVDTFDQGLTPANAVEIVRQYDVILDCTDNPSSRYLISDTCAVLRKPLVSGAALGAEGQLSVYCLKEDTPCYRCLFPQTLAPEHCQRCADGGVLGPLPGVIGTLQALEAIKILSQVGEPLARKLLVFDPMGTEPFMSIKLRSKVPSCPACGVNPTITEESIAEYDYTGFTGGVMNDKPAPRKLLSEHQRVAATDLYALSPPDQSGSQAPEGDQAKSSESAAREPDVADADVADVQKWIRRGEEYVLVDVRPVHQFAIAALPGAINAPMGNFSEHKDSILRLAGYSNCDDDVAPANIDTDSTMEAQGSQSAAKPVVVLCRRGNDSQLAVQELVEAGVERVWDVTGGLEAWHTSADMNFPSY